MSRFVVIGLGIFGEAVLDTLMEGGHEVIGIDSQIERVNAMRDRGTEIVCLDARDPDALCDEGAASVDVAVIALGEAFETAILAALNLRDLGVPKVIVRARNQRERRIFEAVGVYHVVCPEEEAGRNLAQILMDPEIHDWHRISGDFSMATLDAPALLVDRTVLDSELRTRYGVNLIAIHRPVEGSSRLVVPRPETKIMEGDRLVLAGPDSRLEAFIELV